MRYFFQISYRGTSFYGWQRQKGQISVQEAIETELQKLFRSEKIEIVGCGRTDTGVHAKQYFFHTDFSNEIDTNNIQFKLNRMLPSSISVQHIFSVNEELHARFSAKTRTYRYYINQVKDPFLAGLSTYFPNELNLFQMENACRYLMGTQDFTSFAKVHTDVKTHICTIKKATWYRENDQLVFEISADRFLRNMVRSIVGTLLDVGIGKLEVDEVKNIIAAKNRAAAAKSVSAEGLFLWKIDYPSE
jgi:tRNA pseudouridine38-40 synthase